jgi:hypothetical protein
VPRRRKQLVEIKNWLSHPRYKWLAVYRQGGKAQRRYFKTEKDARAFASEKIVELLNEGSQHAPITESERRAIYVAREAGVDVATAIDEAIARHAAKGRSVSIELAAEQLVERRESEGKSRAHVKSLRGGFRAFCRAHEGALCAEITSIDIDQYLASLNVQAQTRLNNRRIIHNLFSFAVARGYATSNPVAHSIRPKVPPKAPAILTVEQTRSLIEECSSVILPAVAIGLFAGLRTSASGDLRIV